MLHGRDWRAFSNQILKHHVALRNHLSDFVEAWRRQANGGKETCLGLVHEARTVEDKSLDNVWQTLKFPSQKALQANEFKPRSEVWTLIENLGTILHRQRKVLLEVILVQFSIDVIRLFQP